MLWKTKKDFLMALQLRDWHMSRVLRFIRGRPLHYNWTDERGVRRRISESLLDLKNSLLIADTLTRAIGDGLYPRIPRQLLERVASIGYVQVRD